jgi:hypothetical protein
MQVVTRSFLFLGFFAYVLAVTQLVTEVSARPLPGCLADPDLPVISNCKDPGKTCGNGNQSCTNTSIGCRCL